MIDVNERRELLERAAVLAYGLLWQVNTDDKRVHRARRTLLNLLSKEQQRVGIEMARDTFRDKSAQKDSNG